MYLPVWAIAFGAVVLIALGIGLGWLVGWASTETCLRQVPSQSMPAAQVVVPRILATMSMVSLAKAPW